MNLGTFCPLEKHQQILTPLVMESRLARLGSGSSRNFLLLLEKLEPKNQQSGLKSLIDF
jgi:hypothetical protein